MKLVVTEHGMRRYASRVGEAPVASILAEASMSRRVPKGEVLPFPRLPNTEYLNSGRGYYFVCEHRPDGVFAIITVIAPDPLRGPDLAVLYDREAGDESREDGPGALLEEIAKLTAIRNGTDQKLVITRAHLRKKISDLRCRYNKLVSVSLSENKTEQP